MLLKTMHVGELELVDRDRNYANIISKKAKATSQNANEVIKGIVQNMDDMNFPEIDYCQPYTVTIMVTLQLSIDL